MHYVLMTGENCMRNKELRACRVSESNRNSRNSHFLNFGPHDLRADNNEAKWTPSQL